MRVLRGNDILINWSVFYDAGGVKTNVDFSNSTLSVFILDSYGKRAVEHTVSGNIISIHYGGEIQRLGTIAIDAYWQNNNTLVWSRAKKNEVVELVDNPESVALDGIPTDISITTINTSSDTFFGGTYNANFSNYYTKEQIDNKIISDYNFLSNKPLIYDEETGKYTAVNAPINFVNNINIGNFVAGASGINFATNGSGEVGTLTVRDRLIVNGVEITGSGTGGLDVANMWNVLGSADDSDKQINVVHLIDALSGYLQTSIFDDLFEKVNIGTLETPKYAIKAKYDFYSIGEVAAFGAGSSGGSSGGGIIQTVYGISGLSETYSDSNLTETFNAAAIKKIYDNVVALQGGSLVNYSLTGTGNAITGVSKSGSSLNFVKDLSFSVTGHTHSFGDINGLPTTLGGYGITDGVTTTVFNTLVNEFNTHVTSDVHLTATQKNILAHLQIVEGKLQADIDFYSTGEVSAFGAGSGSSSGGGLIQTVYGYSSLGSVFNNTTLTDTFNAYTINQLHTRLSQVELGAAVNVAVGGTGNAITGVTKNGNVLEFTKGLTFSLDGHTHDYIPLSQKGTANGVASLDANGLIISAQLPSYVDDVIEVSTYANLPVSGESGKIYVTTDTNITYRWTSTTYVEISKSIALGETSSTAYRGDLGAIAYAHSQIAGGTGVHISGTERTNWNIAYTNSHTHANKSLLDDFSQSDNDVLNHLSIVEGKLKVDIDLYSLGEVSAFGAGSGSGGSGLIQTVYGLSGLGGNYSDATLTDTFNAYTINSLHDRINSLEAGSALSFATTGSGNVVTSVTKSGTSVSVVKGLTAVLEGDARLTNSRPNPYALTFSGYSTATYDGSVAISVPLPTNVSQLTNDSGYLSSIDDDLVAIAALTGTSGLLRKTAANTWSLDTNAYLTTIIKAQVEGVLTGNITSHTHNQYLTRNQTITVSGDATGSGTTSIALTLANSGVVAGTYNNSVTQISPFTVDSKGRVTGIGTAVTITPAWASITGKPTTISGYGITDAYTKTQTDSFLALKLDVATFNDLFEKVNIGTTASPVYAIKAKYNFYSVGEVSAFGAGTGSGGSGLIQTVYGYSGLGGAYNDVTLTDTFNAYTINKINTDLNSRIASLESGSALTFTTVGSGNALTSVTKAGTSVTVTKGLTFSVDGHTHAFASLTDKPTTLSGYGITDSIARYDRRGNIIADNINYSVYGFGYSFDGFPTSGSFISFGGLGNAYVTQIQGSYFGAGMYYRTRNDDNGTWNSWRTLLDDVNAYTKASADNTFLKLAGGTMTGALNFSGTQRNISGVNRFYVTDWTDFQLSAGTSFRILDSTTYKYLFKVTAGSTTVEMPDATALKISNNTVWNAGNFTNLNQLTTRNFIDLQNKPTTLSGYGITDALLKSDINVQVGGTKNSQMSWASWNNSDVYGGAIQIREYGYVDHTQSDWYYAPAITFHWGNRNVKRFGMRYDGQLAIDDSPILWTGNYSAYALPLSGGTMTGALNFSGTQRNISGVNRFYVTDWTDFQLSAGTSFRILDSTTYKYLFKVTAGSTTVEMPDATALKISNNTVWHSGNDGTGSGLDADSLDGYQSTDFAKYIFIGSGSINDFDMYGGAFAARVEACVTDLPESNIYNWSLWQQGSKYRGSQFLIHAYYGGTGAWLRSSSGDSNTWNNWRKLAFEDSNVASATRLQTPRSIWGQSFNGEGNVDGKVVVNYEASNGVAIINANLSSSTNNYAYGLNITNSNQNTGIYTVGYLFGVNNSRNNQATGLFYYAGANSTSNRYGLGFYDNDNLLNIRADGNVGIGTISPNYTLDVNGTGKFASKLMLDAAEGLGVYGIRGRTANEQVEMYQKVSIGSPNGWGVFPQAPNFGLSVYGGANFCTNQGNVLIGTTTDDGYKLNVNGTLRATGAVTASIFNGNLNGNANTATKVYAETNGTNSIELMRAVMADNDYFRILVGGTASNSGYVEIATGDDGTEPIYVRQYSGVFTSLVRTATLLDEAGNTSFPGSVAGSRIYTGFDSGVANSISCSGWFRSNGTSGWVNNTYGGGINMTDTTYVRVYNNKSFWVDNNIVATGEITAFGASDIRLKSNIKQIDSALDFLGKVKTYEFDWNEKAIELNPLKTKKGAGVIAQEMSLLDNNFVHSIYGDYLGVDYDRFIPYLIGGVNEVADEVTMLKKEVTILKEQIKQLELWH